ncbi:hypothetical protein M431DRAFT_509236, partial [Trichoderma harzianum CBS 226.95]
MAASHLSLSVYISFFVDLSLVTFSFLYFIQWGKTRCNGWGFGVLAFVSFVVIITLEPGQFGGGGRCLFVFWC